MDWSPIVDLPPHVARRLVSALECGLLPLDADEVQLEASVGALDHGSGVRTVLGEMSRLGVPPRAAAAWISSLVEAQVRTELPDLVWSGPKPQGVAARDTRQVYSELLGQAERTLWVASYAYYEGPKTFDVLAQRMENRPDLRVRLLLNIHGQDRHRSTPDDLVRRFADRFWTKDWPGQRHPQVFYDPRSIDPTLKGAVLHAKVTVADDRLVFVTSANLTEAAWDRNIELGVLHRDRALARSVATFLERLISEGHLVPLPSS